MGMCRSEAASFSPLGTMVQIILTKHCIFKAPKTINDLVPKQRATCIPLYSIRKLYGVSFSFLL